MGLKSRGKTSQYLANAMLRRSDVSSSAHSSDLSFDSTPTPCRLGALKVHAMVNARGGRGWVCGHLHHTARLTSS